MKFLDRQETGLQTVFLWADNTRKTNVPAIPADFEIWPGKYALDCDQPGLGAWVPNPNYDPDPENASLQQVRIEAVKDAGRARVFRDFDDQDQRRLAFKSPSLQARKDCDALIEAVKAAVDEAETAIQGTNDPGAMDGFRDGGLRNIAAL